MYSRTNLTGMPCVVLRRSSSKAQGTSISNQGRTVDSVISHNQLNVVKEFVLSGVTGSIPGNRSDIDDTIELVKKLGLARMVLLVPDHTRFTRAGAGHGGHLLYRLRAAGILVYFVAEDLLVESDLTLQMALMLLAAAHQTAKSIARSATIGIDASFLKGNSPYTRRPPLGLDRMYFLDGKPLHIIRNMPDGTQQMLDPLTRDLIRTFGKNPKNGVPAHFIKQKNETVALCPGAPEDMAKLFMLMELRYGQHLKYNQIARKLNDEGITSASGGEWSPATVMTTVLNPIYVGLAIRGRRTRSIYVQGGSPNGEPEPSEVTPEELDERAHVRERRRPRSKWVEKRAEAFENFLPQHLRDTARVAILNHLDRIADGNLLQKINRDPHAQSLYFLKYILHCKQTKLPMTGRLTGNKGRQIRKYAISKGTHIPRTGAPSRKRVDADPIEASVLGLVRRVVLDRPAMVDALTKVVALAERASKGQGEGGNTVAEMQKQIRRLRKQIALLSDQVGDDDGDDQHHRGDDPIVRKVEQAKREIARLTLAIRQAGAALSPKPCDASRNIERLATDLQRFGRKIDPSDVPLIRAVAELLVRRLEVDRETMEFELELAVPSWLGHVLQLPLPAGLDSLIACKPQIEADPENGAILQIFRCTYERMEDCHGCRRAA